jgi:hypothetical protein
VNAETVTLIERPYQEIVDDILTATVGGVVNEPLFYDEKETLYPLAQPAQDVRGITGTRTISVNDELQQVHHAFQKEVDFLFSEGDNAVVWQDGGVKPDDESIFYVDYFRRDSRSPLSDINVGSVTRTLGEAIGREVATVYQQINQAYRSGFVDTAAGKSLDFVVAILGVVRKTKDFAIGQVTFFRDPTAGDGNITIPEGTALSTAKGEATFVTTQMRTLQRGQVRIDLPVRAGDASKGEAGIVKSGAINTLSQPITGVNRITNFEDTILGTEDESDEELRARAKAVLRGLGKATLAALAREIFEGRATLTEALDPNSPPAKKTEPGRVVLLIESEPERFPSLRARIEETRAAGVEATLVARYVFFKPRMTARIASGLPAAGKIKLVNEIIAAMQSYVDGLSAGDPAKGADLLSAIKKDVKEVSEAKIVAIIAWRADIGQPGAETLVEALLEAIAAAPAGDTAALRTALTRIAEGIASPAPTGRRIPDLSLVQNSSGQRASDDDIDAGNVQVAAKVNEEDWSVVLDVEPADIFCAGELTCRRKPTAS